jgi:outer membrane protein assembly factor BamB
MRPVVSSIERMPKIVRPAAIVRRSFRTFLLAASVFLSGCELLDLFAPGASELPAEPEWEQKGSLQTRFYKDITASNDVALAPDPILTSSGVVFSTTAGGLVALNPASGAVNWELPAPSPRVDGSAMAAGSGTLFAATQSGAIGLSASGPPLFWQYDSPVDARMSALNSVPGERSYTGTGYPLIDAGVGYLPAWGGSLSAIDLATGDTIYVWKDDLLLPNPSGTTGAAVSGDTLFVHTWNKPSRSAVHSKLHIVAIRKATGVTLWRKELPKEGYGTTPFTKPLLSGENLIVQQLASIAALNKRTGDIVWEYNEPAKGLSLSHIAVDAGRVYLNTGGGLEANAEVVALDAATGTVVWRSLVYFEANSDIVVSERCVYAVNYAFISIVDRTTGRLLVRVNPPNFATRSAGLLSAPVVTGGNVLVRVGEAITNGTPNVTYRDYVWSFREPR